MKIKGLISLTLVLAIAAMMFSMAGCGNDPVGNSSDEQPTSSNIGSENPSSSEEAPSSEITSSEVVDNTKFIKLDMDDNVFMDSLEYTGYNLEKHRNDGKMWQYVLAAQKRGLGWLSQIGYAGTATGYETKDGKPDIDYFVKKGGLVCASYVTYVYFNYLPNVAGIDTSFLDKPESPVLANSWLKACDKWVQKGYSRYIDFNASITSSKWTNFSCNEEIPIGSLVFWSNALTNNTEVSSHIAIYAGYKNGHNWVYQVGNANGPEFCAIERMAFGPDPQRMMAIVTPPSNLPLK